MLGALQPGVDALIIPEKSFGEGYWAACKAFERQFYIGDDAVEAPRVVRKSVFESIGGYDEALTGFEDWDFTRRLRAIASVGRINR